MGKKTNTISLHINRRKDWNSVWFSDLTNYGYVFKKDYFLYLYLKSLKELNYQIDFECFCYRVVRVSNIAIVDLVLSKKEKQLIDFSFKKTQNVLEFKWFLFSSLNRFLKQEKELKIFSKRRTTTSAKYVALLIGRLIEKRVKFKSTLIYRFLKHKVKRLNGIDVRCKGRLNGVDRASSDRMIFGSVPSQSFDVFIDYGFAIANTLKGLQSIKVWVFKK